MYLFIASKNNSFLVLMLVFTLLQNNTLTEKGLSMWRTAPIPIDSLEMLTTVITIPCKGITLEKIMECKCF